MGYGNTEVFLTPQQRETLIRSWMGKTVTVTIDRPVGFHHVTKGVHLHYTINYGFCPGLWVVTGKNRTFTFSEFPSPWRPLPEPSSALSGGRMITRISW